VYTRSGAEILIDEDVVKKVHRLGTDVRALRARLIAAAQLAARPDACLIPPLSTEPELVPGAEVRWQTSWPRVEVVAPDPDLAPWREAGSLLAQLHREPIAAVAWLPPHGGAARLPRALDRAAGLESAAVLRRAAADLPAPAWEPGSARRPVTVVHGDWHLGQLGRLPGETRWQLIDIDDLGLGDPAWDLARPAGFWAAGLLADDDWRAFLDGYRGAGGPAVPAGDPWPALEPLARAAVVQAAAVGMVAGIGDDAQGALLAACARMAGS
jgi:aminoglycoside phosphotransferase (APT) family kinase protein